MVRPAEIDAALKAAARRRTLAPALSVPAPSAVRRIGAPAVVPAPGTRHAQSLPSDPTASGTGINPWWRYQEENLPGGGRLMINIGTGNLLLQDDDMAVPHKGIAMAFRRSYNSQMPTVVPGYLTNWQSLYGNGWTNTFDAHIVATSPTQKSVYDIDGARYDYVAGGGHYTSLTPGQHAVLAWDGACGMTWTKKSGTIYYFYVSNPATTCPSISVVGGYAGRLYQIIGRNRNTFITFNYSWDNGDASTTGKISQITAQTESGMTATLAFADFNGRRLLNSLTLPDGATNVYYAYDGNGNPTTVWEPANTTTGNPPPLPTKTFGYTALGTGFMLASVASPRWNASDNGSYVNLAYNGSDVTSSSLIAIAHVGVVNPIVTDGVSSAALQSGYSTAPIEYLHEWYQTGMTTPTVRDTDGHFTNWVVDGAGRPTQTQACTATTGIWTCNGTYLVTNETWDANNNLVSSTDPRGFETDYAYDAMGNTIAVAEPQMTVSQGTFRPTALYSYDSFNNVTAYCAPNAAHQLSGDWNNAAPPSGDSTCPINSVLATRYVWSTDPTQSGTASANPAYEPFGELQAHIRPGTSAAPNGYRVNFSYDPARQGGNDFGLPTTAQGATPIAQVDGTSRQPVQNFWYDSNGNLGCYDKGSGQWILSYDSLGRVLSAADPDDTGAGTGICGKSSGTAGWSTAETTSYYPNGIVSARQTPSQRASGVSTSFTYDLDGNEQSETHHYGCTSTSSCTAGVTNKWYDGADRLVEVSLPYDQWDVQGYPLLTRYIYDLTQGGSTPYQGGALRGYGNLVKTQEYLSGTIITPITAATETSFTQLPPSSGSWIDVRATSFDGIDRAVSAYEAAFSNQPKVANTYDGTGFDGRSELGLLTSSLLATGEQKLYSYDELGRLTDTSYRYDGGATSPSHIRYDASGNVSSRGTDVLGTESYQYDFANEKLSTTKPPLVGGAVIGYHNYPDGMRQDLTFTSSLTSASPLYRYAYRSDSQRSALLLSNGTSFKWTYSSGGRLLTQSDPFTGTTVTTSNGYTNARESRFYLYYPASVTYQPKTYSFDNYGRVTGVTLPPGVFSQSTARDLEDGMTSISATAVQSPSTATGSTCTMSNIRNEKVPVYASSGCGGRLYNGAVFELASAGAISGDFSATPPLTVPWTVDARSGMLLSWQGATAADGNTSNRHLTYDASGRITGDTALVDRPSSGTSDPYNNGTRLIFTGMRTKSYDAENRIRSQQTTRDLGMGPLVNGTQATDTGGYFTDIGSPSAWQLQAVDYSADSHPERLSTTQNGPTTDAFTFLWLWDGDDLLAQCYYDATYSSGCSGWSFSVEGFATYAPASGATVEDRGISGQIVSSHNNIGFTGMRMIGRITRSMFTNLAAVAPSSCDCGEGENPLLARKVATDGWTFDNNTWQGVRTMDASIGTWTTPDAYHGDVHDPMSQKPYMWNRNNPFDYSDPSGLDTIIMYARDSGHLRQSHVFIEVVRDPVHGQPSVVIRYSFGPRDDLHPRGSKLERKGNDYDGNFTRGRNTWGKTVLADCTGTCTLSNGGFDEASLDKTADAIDEAGWTYGLINSNSAAHTLCNEGGGGGKCNLEPGFWDHDGAFGWGLGLMPPPHRSSIGH